MARLSPGSSSRCGTAGEDRGGGTAEMRMGGERGRSYKLHRNSGYLTPACLSSTINQCAGAQVCPVTPLAVSCTYSPPIPLLLFLPSALALLCSIFLVRLPPRACNSVRSGWGWGGQKEPHWFMTSLWLFIWWNERHITNFATLNFSLPPFPKWSVQLCVWEETWVKIQWG